MSLFDHNNFFTQTKLFPEFSTTEDVSLKNMTMKKNTQRKIKILRSD